MLQLLGLSGGRTHLGQLVLLSDTLTDGSFLVHHFLSQSFRDGHHTVLLSLTQSLLHYSSVCSKLGVNLHAKSHFVFVDGLTTLLSAVLPSAMEHKGDKTKENRQRVSISIGSDYSLTDVSKTLEQVIRDGVKEDEQQPTCLIIDGLSMLLSVGVPLGHVMSLVHRCVHLLTSSDGPCHGEGYVVVMVHREEGEEGEPEETLYRHLLHLCHLDLQAKGLSTGYSKDVHGEVSVNWRDPVCSGTELLPPQTAQYKLTDKSVQIFAKGLSKAVI